MAVGRRWLVVCCASFATLVLALAAHHLSWVRVTHATMSGPDGVAHAIELPYSGETPIGEPLDVAFDVRASWLTQRSFVFVPDDHLLSIAVNGAEVSLAEVDPRKMSDFRNGFSFPLGPLLRRGDNRVVVRLLNVGGPGGLDVHPDARDWPNRAEGAVAVTALLVLLLGALAAAGVPRGTIAVAVVAVGLRFAYLSVTPYWQRAHDAEGHLEYVRYVLLHHASPRPSEGYSFFHPPLYYGVSALLWKLLDVLGVAKEDILVSLQVESIVFNLGFSAFGVATVWLWVRRVPVEALGRGAWTRSGLEALAAALILLWPSNVLHSARIGNDDLTYLFIGAGLFFASRWWLEADPLDANLAAVSAALGVVTKTNSLLVFAVLVLLLAARLSLRWCEGRPAAAKSVLQQAWPALGLLVTSCIIAFAKTFAATRGGRQGNFLITNASWNPAGLNVGVGLRNFLWLDLPTFVRQPFTSPWEDSMGRQYFWHFLLKTSLFGEWLYESPWARAIATFLSVALLGMGLYGAIGTLLRGRRAWLDELPLFGLAGALIAGSIALRRTLPGVSSGDFRYVLPVLVPCAWWYVRAAVSFRERGWRKVALAGHAMGWLVAAASVAFVAVVVVTAD